MFHEDMGKQMKAMQAIREKQKKAEAAGRKQEEALRKG